MSITNLRNPLFYPIISIQEKDSLNNDHKQYNKIIEDIGADILLFYQKIHI